MPDTTATTTTESTETTTQQTPPAATGGDTDWKAEADKWKAMARKHENQAKANTTELEQLRQQSMSDQEKAVAKAVTEAQAAGYAAAKAEAAQALATEVIRSATAGRMTDDQVESLLEATNLTVFITDSGEVDRVKVAKFVDGIAPKPSDDDEKDTRQGFPDLGQGARSGGNNNVALNGDPLLRDLKAKLGIR